MAISKIMCTDVANYRTDYHCCNTKNRFKLAYFHVHSGKTSFCMIILVVKVHFCDCGACGCVIIWATKISC